MLDKGVPTGGKHCVPLANIFLSFIMRDLLRTNESFRNDFETKMKLWKRFIDDCGGVFLGKEHFQNFFNTLNGQFDRFELQLTFETSDERIHFLDIEVYIDENQFQTKEHRKETATNSYVKFGSAHPKHCFKGIVKSQMQRIRRLCSKNSDFIDAVANLRQRCLNSGYDMVMVDGILGQASTLRRELIPNIRDSEEVAKHSIRWVVLSGVAYEQQIRNFVSRINQYLDSHNIKLDLVKSTGSSISNLLFNNNVKFDAPHQCSSSCVVCSKGLRGDTEQVVSPSNGRSYSLNKNLNCTDGGIYAISCACTAQYTGKTTTAFSKRFSEHFQKNSNSAVHDHSRHCQIGKRMNDFSIQFLENVHSRGKYSLSEREHLWNSRLRGIVNIQKTLMS